MLRISPSRTGTGCSCFLHYQLWHSRFHEALSRRGRRAAALGGSAAALSTCGSGRYLACRGCALGRIPRTLVPDLDPVITELVTPVLTDERPYYVLVVRPDVLDRLIRPGTGDALLLRPQVRLD